MVWGLCTLCTILALACCTVEERRAQAKSQERTLYTHANSPPSAPASLHATEPVASPRVELATKPPQGSARSDPSLANDAFLSQLPVRIQYAAARAIEESGEDGAVARISWLAQPQMLPLIVRPTLLWLLMTAIQPILLLTYQPPIPLPTEAELGGHCYVPAGWFRSGGDPLADSSLPGRRLWCGGLIVRRFVVRHDEYCRFLDGLTARPMATG